MRVANWLKPFGSPYSAGTSAVWQKTLGLVVGITKASHVLAVAVTGSVYDLQIKEIFDQKVVRRPSDM